MKQVIIINNTLKMSKGKIARVCAALGFKSHTLMSMRMINDWYNEFNQKTVVLKSDEYDNDIKTLEKNKISFEYHMDLGLTEVPPNSNCGCVFFIDDDDKLFENHKLL